jgi:hypothetical protein
LLNDNNNNELDKGIKIKLSYLIQNYTVVDNLLNDGLYYLALSLIEKFKQWRTVNINKYLFSSNNKRCRELIDILQHIKLFVINVIYKNILIN